MMISVCIWGHWVMVVGLGAPCQDPVVPPKWWCSPLKGRDVPGLSNHSNSLSTWSIQLTHLSSYSLKQMPSHTHTHAYSPSHTHCPHSGPAHSHVVIPRVDFHLYNVAYQIVTGLGLAGSNSFSGIFKIGACSQQSHTIICLGMVKVMESYYVCSVEFLM